MSGYAALRESAAWLDISSRGKILVRGDDRAGFIHAMCSNEIESLTAGSGTYAFFLDAQGHIQSDSRIYVSEDHLWLDTPPGRVDALIRHLEKFIIMDDVTLEDQTPGRAALALEGPRSEEVAKQALQGALPPARENSHVEIDGTRVVRSSLTGQPGLWLITEKARGGDLAAKLEEAGAAAASAEDARVVRVENQAPSFGEDFFDSSLPQETQLLQALSFQKGCYLGQEIVERVRSRGQVRRLLVPLELEGAAPPPAGSAVLVDGKEAGQLTSPVFSPRLGRVIGFAILRREAAAAGTEIRVNELRGRVREALI